MDGAIQDGSWWSHVENFLFFGLITEYMNWQSMVLFLLSLKKFLVFKINLPQYALCTIKNTHRGLVDNIGDLVFAK